MSSIKIRTFGVRLWRISYFISLIYYVFLMLIPGIEIMGTFNTNVTNVKKAEGVVFFKRQINRVHRIGIQLADGSRILFFCDAGLNSTNYICLKDYSRYSVAKKVEGHRAVAEWYEQDIPFRPQASRMLLALTIDGKPHLRKEYALNHYREDVDGIRSHLIYGLLFIVCFIFIFELYAWGKRYEWIN